MSTNDAFIVWDGRGSGMPQSYSSEEKAVDAFSKIVTEGRADINKGLFLTKFVDISDEAYNDLLDNFAEARDSGFEGLQTEELRSHKASVADWVEGSLDDSEDDEFDAGGEDYVF